MDTADVLGTPHLRLRREGPIAWLTVDNPARRNSLTMAMYRGLGRAITYVDSDPVLQILVVTGVDDVFISGGDINDHDDAHVDDDALPFDLMAAATVPVIAAVNGHCQASGVWLVALADVAVASERARFRLPELRLGVAAPWSATILPSIIGLARAKDLALTARSFAAVEAREMGLIARVVAEGDLIEYAREVALAVLETAPVARRAWKALAHASLPQVKHADVEASIRTAEAEVGLASFLDRRPPPWSLGLEVRSSEPEV